MNAVIAALLVAVSVMMSLLMVWLSLRAFNGIIVELDFIKTYMGRDREGE